MALNSKLTRNKFSVAEKSINKFLMFMLGMLVLESVFSTILNATIEIKHGKPSKFAFLLSADHSRGGHVSIMCQGTRMCRKPSWLSRHLAASARTQDGRSYCFQKCLVPSLSVLYASTLTHLSSTHTEISAGSI